MGINILTNFEVLACDKCKALFAIPEETIVLYRESHKNFYCPYCKDSMFYPQVTDKEKLKKELNSCQLKSERLQIKCERVKDKLEYTKNSLRSTKGVVTKLKKAKKND